MDLAIVLLSIMGITLEEIDLNASLPINPTIIRIMRVLRITRGMHTHARAVRHKYTETRAVWLMSPCPVSVLKLLKMATGMRALLDTVIQALPQVTHGPKAAEHKSCLWMLALCQLTRFHFLPDSPSGLFNPNKQHHLNTKSWKLSARLLIHHCIHIFKACFNCFATGYLWR